MKSSGLLLLILIVLSNNLIAQNCIQNIDSRNKISLNGDWQVIIDPTDNGEWRKVWKDPVPLKKTDFFEYGFNKKNTLRVPGDFNSQLPELKFIEGTVWYKKSFNYSKNSKRLFLYFGAANYKAKVFLNGKFIGEHEGGFTLFQFEISKNVKEGANSVVVKVDNRRVKNGLPSTGYDWLNYGGITRDVFLVETNQTYINDYFIQLKKGSLTNAVGWVQLQGSNLNQKVEINIPELKIHYKANTGVDGRAEVKFSGKFNLWSPAHPKLYKVQVVCETDTIWDEIGFRCIEVEGNMVLLNKKPIFLKGVNIHEENPLKGSRACSKEDAELLLNSAKELGCNLVRLAHYPHNENMVRQAETMGLMVWDELPIYQHIEFADSVVPVKMERMLKEMIARDKNRCGVIIWSLSNETYSFTPNRDNALVNLTKKCRSIDSTRLITHVISTQGYENNTFNVWDTLYRYCDIMSINEYIGWYVPWQGKPTETKWNLVCPDKPLFISEFGGEAQYGNHTGPPDEANWWNEEYQEQIYKDQIQMFENVPNLAGVCPWILYDFKSTSRLNPVYQEGYNRKGLLSEHGDKKKAWFIMKSYFDSIK